LTEDQIVEAALSLAGSARLESVSMRALAQQLGVPVMTIYNYVPNKDALYELVLNAVLRSVRVPSPDEGTWEERLKRLERDARFVMGKFPGLSFDRRGTGSAEGARLAEGVMSILASAGFDDTAALLAFAALFTFMVGQIDVDIDVTEVGGPLAAAIRSVTSVTNLSRDEVFEFGFDAVIEGLKAKLASQPSRATKRRRRATR
jgi:AcrR family transcriptional regulator